MWTIAKTYSKSCEDEANVLPHIFFYNQYNSVHKGNCIQTKPLLHSQTSLLNKCVQGFDHWGFKLLFCINYEKPDFQIISVIIHFSVIFISAPVIIVLVFKKWGKVLDQHFTDEETEIMKFIQFFHHILKDVRLLVRYPLSVMLSTVASTFPIPDYGSQSFSTWLVFCTLNIILQYLLP